MADGGHGGGFLDLAAGNGGAPAVVADQDVAPALLPVVGVQGPHPPAAPLGGHGGLQALALPAVVGVQGPPPPLGGHGGQAFALPADVGVQGPPPPLGGHEGQALALPAGVGVEGPPPPAAPFGGDGGQALALQAVVGHQGPPPPALGQQQPGVGIGDMALGELLELADTLDEPEASVTTAEAREQLSRMVEKMKHVMEQTTPEMPMVQVNPPPPPVVVRQSGDTPLLAAGDAPATPAHMIPNQSAPPAYVIRHSASIPPFVPDPPAVPPPVVPPHPFAMMGGAAAPAGIGSSVMPPLVAAAAGSDDPMPPQFAGMVLPAIKNPRPLQMCKACGERLQWLNKNHGDTKPPNPLQPHFCLCEPCQKSEKTRVEFCGDCGAYDARINPKPPGNL